MTGWTAGFVSVFFSVILIGCANVSTTKYTYTGKDGSTMSIEMPKEVDAQNFKVDMDPTTGKASVTADKITTKNVETIKAQAARETQNIKAAGDVTKKVGGAVGTGLGTAAKTAILP